MLQRSPPQRCTFPAFQAAGASPDCHGLSESIQSVPTVTLEMDLQVKELAGLSLPPQPPVPAVNSC